MKKGKKFVSLFLIFSLLSLSGNLFANKRGAELIVQKTDWQKVRGELIAVKQNSLLMLVSGADVSIDIGDVWTIKIVKKSDAVGMSLLGAFVGVLIGDVSYPEPTGRVKLDFSGAYLLVGGIVGGLIGLLAGVMVGIDKTIQIEGRPDTEVKEALEKLRKKARIPDYE